MNAKTATLDDGPLRTGPIRPTGDVGDGWGRAAAYDAYADGLHTYAIWSLRDHDGAADALYCTFVIADRHVTQLRQPEHVQPWLYAIMRRECMLRASADSLLPSSPLSAAATPSASPASSASSETSPVNGGGSPAPVSGRLRPPSGSADPSGSLASLERNLRRAEFHSLEWPESEGLVPAHREILELTIRHGLDSHGLGLVLGLGRSSRTGRVGGADAIVGSVGSQGFGVLADAWRELERSLAAVAVAKASHEHCAQLAELTFGWTGRLTADLRAPLADHVDGCTRCQHYLHTVIGTPAAPTILPFVAAPRSLRDILLSELHDPMTALRLGVDHDEIAARVQRFTPDGFPLAVAGHAPVRRRVARRVVPKTAGDAPVAAAEEPTSTSSLPRRAPGAARPSDTPRVRLTVNADDDDATSVYRVPGSWAARVLPADSTTVWRPSGTQGADESLPPLRSGERHGRRHDDSPNGFISTPSGRFAARAPIAGDTARDNGAGASIKAVAGVATNGKPRSRARHKSRPMRQAVVSAVALGAAGAAAAASAALLGAASDNHSNHVADSAPSWDPAAGPGRSDGLSVSVSTPAAPDGPVGAHVPNALGPGANGPTSAPGIVGTGIGGGISGGIGGDGVISSTAAPTSAPTAGTGVNPADFHVSVNQRAADPNSVTILLRNVGSVPITWSAAPHDRWITLSESSGTLAAGQSQAITATATSAAPPGPWTSTVTFSPGGAVVTVRGGYGSTSGPTSPATSAPPSSSATPSSPGQSSAPPSSSATPTPTPTPSAGASSAGGVHPSTSRSVSPSDGSSGGVTGGGTPSTSASSTPAA